MKCTAIVSALALAALCVGAAAKQQTGKVAPKTNTKTAAKAKAKAKGMNCPKMNKTTSTAKGTGGSSAAAAGCCAGMKGGSSDGMKDMGQTHNTPSTAP